MKLLILIFLGVVGWMIYSRLREKPSQGASRGVSQPRITVSMSNGSGELNSPPVDVGNLIERAPGEYTLNPKSPLPLTVKAPSAAVAAELKGYLDEEARWGRKMSEIVFLIAQHNISCPDLDDFAAMTKQQYLESVIVQKNSSIEWGDASDLDREDMMIEFKEKALEELKMAPPNREHLLALFENVPSDITADDALLKRFDGDTEAYRLFLAELGGGCVVRTVPADSYHRKRFETLAQLGFARRGQDVELRGVIESLRLKDINEMVVDLMPKPIGRKVAAVEFALNVADIRERLAKIISFRELFQVTAPSNIDVSSLEKCYSHANAVAWLLRDTYVSGSNTVSTIRDSRGASYDYWEISSDDCCDECSKLNGKRTKQRPSKLPPFHIGCECTIDGGYN